jgi:hypothetical protein
MALKFTKREETKEEEEQQQQQQQQQQEHQHVCRESVFFRRLTMKVEEGHGQSTFGLERKGTGCSCCRSSWRIDRSPPRRTDLKIRKRKQTKSKVIIPTSK